jgi:energy-coupling factor transporter ATP-binding protein EcfA2
MTNNKIIPAADRTASPRGAKALIVGPTGVGKTSLLRTLGGLLSSTLFIDVEAGDLAVQDLAVDTFRPRTWPQCRDLAVVLAGPNPAVLADAVYSEAHYNAAIAELGSPKRYDTFFIDSLTAVGRLCFAWASQQPEAFSERSGKRDLRGAYGLFARELVGWLMCLQQARAVNVVFLGILETVTDDYNRTEHRLQLEGSRASRELPAVLDQVVTFSWVNFGDGVLTRAFICSSPNPWQFPAKDRSGRLEQVEEPHLGKLLAKLSAKSPGGDSVETQGQLFLVPEAAQ